MCSSPEDTRNNQTLEVLGVTTAELTQGSQGIPLGCLWLMYKHRLVLNPVSHLLSMAQL